MEGLLSHPAVAALTDSFAVLLATIEAEARALEATTWMLLVLAVAAVWMFAVKPPA